MRNAWIQNKKKKKAKMPTNVKKGLSIMSTDIFNRGSYTSHFIRLHNTVDQYALWEKRDHYLMVFIGIFGPLDDVIEIL